MTLPLTDTYLLAVAAELADLEAADRDDLLEDLQLHLAELRAEDPDVDLLARLGTPADYAAELRQSAGLPAPSGGPSWRDRLGALRNSLVDRASRRPWVLAVVDFLPQLRPAWWVLRAYGVVALVDHLFHQGNYRWGVGIVPQVHGQGLLGFVLLAVLVVASVRLATRPPAWRVWGRTALVANAVLAIATPAYFFSMQGDTYVQTVIQQTSVCCNEVVGDDGRTLTNLFGYDGQGHLVPQLQLFDQDGKPVTMSGETQPGELATNVYPHPVYLEDGSYGIPTPPPLGGPQVLTPTPSPTAQATPVR